MSNELNRLSRDLLNAERREYNDDHLNDQERLALVERYERLHGVHLQGDLCDRFLAALEG